MNIGKDMIEYIKSYVIEDLLDDTDDGYTYYIDEVALAIDPTDVHVFLYTNAPKEIVAHLLKSGLVFSNNVDNCQTMTYRDMLYVTITTSEERYETMENENCKMEAISLGNIVEWAKGRGCNKEETINLLRRATLCTC
jgi:hypothetical protein